MSDISTNTNPPILPGNSQNFTEVHSSSSHPTPTPAPTPAPYRDPRDAVLSDRQLNAIPLILAGNSDNAVAQAVGVCRESVWKWRNSHPRFIAELNRARLARQTATIDRFDRLLNRSLDFIETFYEYEHDSWRPDQRKMALAFLRTPATRRALTSTTPLPTNPSVIEDQLLYQHSPLCPDDSPAEDAPPPPPPPPTPAPKPRKARN